MRLTGRIRAETAPERLALCCDRMGAAKGSISDLEDYVFQAFDMREFHYLGKPFDDRKFAVEQYDGNSVHEQGSIVIFVQEKGILIALENFLGIS